MASSLRDLWMTPDTRNTRVVVLLMLSMTFGAALLMWLETPRLGWSESTFLMAETGSRVDEVTVFYVPPSQPVGRGEFDCVILPDQEPLWDPRPGFVGRARVAVIGTGASELSAFQQQQLLNVLGSMRQQRGLPIDRVQLHPSADPRRHDDLPDEAVSLADLLARKGIGRP